jgi:DNA mismatch repair protein MutL
VGLIQRLPDELIDKIAAGEVVERPASVVKELVENSLDAGARSVRVELEKGGKALLRVRDDGAGMSREDAALAVERHATSKLRSLQGLNAITTSGFRGEALAAIGGVARLRLLTREADARAGTEVVVAHGRLQHVMDAGHPRGTTVEVSELFGSVPARKKFLRAESTETSHVAETVTLLALARPDVGFTLSSQGRTLLEAPPVAEPAARLQQLFGRETLERLAPVDGGAEWARVLGFVAKAGRQDGSRPMLRLFVNGRPVRDRGIARAVSEGYRRAGQPDPKGESFLFVEAPLELVDVNVHPAKSEVRFAEARVVWEAVTRAVSAALSRDSRARAAGGASRVAEAAEPYAPAAAPALAASAVRPLFGVPEVAAVEPGPRVLGQHRHIYIVASDGEELVLVDQHTAHERVRFERLLQALERRAVDSQRLLVPAVFELQPRLRPLLEQHAASLRELGFELEPFGGAALRVAAVPAVLGTRDPGPALEALLRELAEREATDWIVTGARERLAATLACHSAARAGEPLSRELMAAIVADLMQTAHPTQCPHGRPTLVRLPADDVSRWFGRVGWRRR